MPNGCSVPLPASNEAKPFVSNVVPFECRLSPLHPGYVKTVCAWIALKNVASASRHIEKDERDGIVYAKVNQVTLLI